MLDARPWYWVLEGNMRLWQSIKDSLWRDRSLGTNSRCPASVFPPTLLALCSVVGALSDGLGEDR